MALLRVAGICRANTEVLRDEVALGALVRRLVHRIGMRPVGEPHVELYPHWPGTAPSLVQFLEESAVVIHTYPEHNAIQISLDSCKIIPNHEAVAVSIIEELDLAVKQFDYDPTWSVESLLGEAQRSYLWPWKVQQAAAKRKGAVANAANRNASHQGGD